MSSEPIILKKWFKDLLAIEKAVAEVSRMFISPDPTDLNLILQVLGKAAVADRAHIIRFQNKTKKINCIYEWCDSDIQPLSQDLGLHTFVHSWLIKKFAQGENIMISDIESMPQEFAAEKKILKTKNIRSLLAIPIYSAMKSLSGCIMFDNSRESREWLGEEVQAFHIIAEMLSIYWERRQAMEALKKSEAKYRELYEKSKKDEQVYHSLINSSADAIVISDLEDRTKYLSPSFINLFGWTLEDVLGKNIPYIPDSENLSQRGLIQDIISNGATCQALETKRMTKDGRIVDVSLSAFRYDDHEGKPAGVLYTLRDISEKKKLEAQLIQAQKMEAIGTLAGGIAHDFNNNLQAIFGCTEIMRLTKDKSHPDYGKLETIERSAQRASNLSKRLLVFSRDIENEFGLVDLNHQIRQVLTILEHTIPKMIRIELDLEENHLKIKADPGQLEQVIMNLGVNARDAMPDGGRIGFKTESVVLNKENHSAHPGIHPGKYLLLTISDTGCGMDKETLKNIFEPFFTTKKKGEGTGLGLAVVYGIVKNHGGHIMCSSEPGKETIFKIYFPIVEETAIIKDLKLDIQTPMKGGNETILFIDDEEVIREIGKETLAGFGYHVITASDSKNAFDLFKENRQRIDLIILDLIMPGKGGRKLLEDFLKIDPNAKIIVASGYTGHDSIGEVKQAGAKEFVSKPYDMKLMLEVIRKVLE